MDSSYSRYWRCFESKKDRSDWENKNSGKIHVCMHLTGKQLKKDLPYLKDLDDSCFVSVYSYLTSKEED